MIKNTNNQYDMSEQLYYKSYFNNRLNYKTKKIAVDDLLFIPVLITTFWASALTTPPPNNAHNGCNITNTFVKLVLSMSQSPRIEISSFPFIYNFTSKILIVKVT